MIHKGSDTEYPENFHPIDLTPCVGKLFHRILASRLEEFVSQQHHQPWVLEGFPFRHFQIFRTCIISEHHHWQCQTAKPPTVNDFFWPSQCLQISPTQTDRRHATSHPRPGPDPSVFVWHVLQIYSSKFTLMPGILHPSGSPEENSKAIPSLPCYSS